MSNSTTKPADPPVLMRQSATKTGLALAVVIGIVVAIGAWVAFQFPSTPDPLIGVWKGTDEYGGQHFYEFRRDGSMLWWDIDRGSDDRLPEERGQFKGTFYYDKAGIIAKAPGFGGRVGILKQIGRDTLHQEFDGHAMRQNLNYTRVSEPSGSP